MNNTVGIYIIAHKQFELPNIDKEIYKVLQVNATSNDHFSEFIDCDGENISNLNKYYAELTGLYWMWKNVDDSIIGLCHYRRYFVNVIGKINNIVLGNKTGYLNRGRIDKLLAHYDVIVHNKTFISNGTVRSDFLTWTSNGEIDICEEVISDICPEYLDAFTTVMNSKSVHLLNMFIMRKELLDSYCAWLFSVLFELQNRLDMNIYNGANSRTIAMLSERLLDVWIVHNKCKVKECFTINTERRDLKISM